MKTWAAMNRRTWFLRVLRARHRRRTPPTFTEGQLVSVWGQGRAGSGKWFGPVVVVLPASAGAWINVRGE
eukprot:8591011-Pyramimonas_sp.AAC.1